MREGLEVRRASEKEGSPLIAEAEARLEAARLALERHRWEEAADLVARTPDDYPWDTAASSEAITYFARALGAARSGRSEQARSDLETLAELQAEVAAASPYWGTQVEIQRLAALAWLQFEEGDRESGLATMLEAAEMEAGTEKHPVTPGEVLPARELLADMLLELGRYSEALAEYEAALTQLDHNFRDTYGAEFDGKDWKIVERRQFTEVTGPGGIYALNLRDGSITTFATVPNDGGDQHDQRSADHSDQLGLPAARRRERQLQLIA